MARTGGGGSQERGAAAPPGPPRGNAAMERLRSFELQLSGGAGSAGRGFELLLDSSSSASEGEDVDVSAADGQQQQQQDSGLRRRHGGGGSGGDGELNGVGGGGEAAVQGGTTKQAVEALSTADWGNMALLVLLYAIQGIPLGLTMGTMPFLLAANLSMTQMGLFSIAAYPYSFKLLWSPIVDSVYVKRWGRRKSWIVPIQAASSVLLLGCGRWMQERVDAGEVAPLTALFFVFVLLAATQDIAVDGWALTLLPPAHVEYASTCQTLGMNFGYFTSFTGFLALSNPEFCATYVYSNATLAAWLGPLPPGTALVTLAGYVRFWGLVFAAVTLAIALFKSEGPERAPPPMPAPATGAAGAPPPACGWRAELRAAYTQLLCVVRLPAVLSLLGVLLTYRLGVLTAEGAAPLQLLDKGVGKESLAALVLIQFPVEMLSAVLAGRWAASASPSTPFLAGYFLRLGAAAALVGLAAVFPAGASPSVAAHLPWFGALAGLSLVTSFSSTLMFTALGSFFNRISDPAMGGAYLTLLNTLANMGVVLPKSPLFALMDALTRSACTSPGGVPLELHCPKKLQALGGPSACVDAGGICSQESNGFYLVSAACAILGLGLGVYYYREFPRLISLPPHNWRAAPQRAKDDSGKPAHAKTS